MPDGCYATDPAVLQRRLAGLNARRFNPALPTAGWRDEALALGGLLLEEGDWLEQRQSGVAVRAAAAPRDADGFVRWFEALNQTGPGQGDALFPWLAEQATLDEMRWFLTQEIAGEAGFDDLAALTQVKMPQQAKLEIARNYWDEMGRGNPKGMHGPMLEAIAHRLDLQPTQDGTVWESLALANVMAGLACNRRYAFHSVGALGVIEQTAPSRAVLVGQGLRRLGVAPDDRHYFDLHAVLDVKHSASWNAEAIGPLVAQSPELAPAIAEGALMRLEAGAACFDRYRAMLWSDTPPRLMGENDIPAIVERAIVGRAGMCVR